MRAGLLCSGELFGPEARWHFRYSRLQGAGWRLLLRELPPKCPQPCIRCHKLARPEIHHTHSTLSIRS
jgi:hypothetical protein